MTDENVPSDSSAEVAPRVRIPLEKGWARAKLIRELALQEQPQTELAEYYGVAQSTIATFKKRHWVEIERIRNNLADEYADLWIAQKRNRLAELQAAAEKLAGKPDARSAEVLAKLLKDAAEELGDLPTRTQVNVNTANVTYEIVGVDPEVLS
jgi:hypothetical protein